MCARIRFVIKGIGRGVLAAFFVVSLARVVVADEASSDPFPLHDSLKSNVKFWVDVYSKYSTKTAVLHDEDDLSVVYDVISLDDLGDHRRRLVQFRVNGKRRYYEGILRQIFNKNLQNLSEEEEAVLKKFPAPVSRERLSMAIRGIRFQLGQKDRFMEGLIRSGSYIDKIKEVFRSEGIPEDLAYLPHVESSFQYNAYSKYGAAGIWQFLRSTGRRYMKVNYNVDERFDPVAATRAAARHLKTEYEMLKSWPLTVLSYNHGANSVKRAVALLGTTDIHEIIMRYEGRTFGFASRNFYPEFLAAREVARNYQKYFGELPILPPVDYDTITLEKSIYANQLIRQIGVSSELFARANPALRAPVLRGYRRIPQGHTVYVPRQVIAAVKHLKFEEEGEILEARASAVAVSAAGVGSEKVDVDKESKETKEVEKSKPVKEPVASKKSKETAKSKPIKEKAPASEVKEPPQEVVEAKLIQEAKEAKQEVLEAKKDKVVAPLPVGDPKTVATLFSKEQDLKFLKVQEKYGWIKADVSETIGHYAEWAKVSAAHLRTVNGVRNSRNLKVGQPFRIDLSRVSREEFERARLEYHRSLEEDFYANYVVKGTVDHTVGRGENLWTIGKDIYDVPAWLIEKYNLGTDWDRVIPGMVIKIPVVEARNQNNGQLNPPINGQATGQLN